MLAKPGAMSNPNSDDIVMLVTGKQFNRAVEFFRKERLTPAQVLMIVCQAARDAGQSPELMLALVMSILDTMTATDSDPTPS